MENINKNKRIYTVLIFGILAMLAYTPNFAQAQSVSNDYSGRNYSYGDPNFSYTNYNNNGTGNNTNTGTGYIANGNYNSNPAPIIYLLSPNNRIVNTGGTEVAITGDNFTPSSVARFNSYDRPTTYYSSTRLNVTLYDGDLKIPGNYLINVYNPVYRSSGGYSNTLSFTVREIGVANIVSSTTTSSKPIARKATTAKVAKVSTPIKSNGLTANVLDSGFSGLFGTNCKFFPNSLIQWLLLLILILVAVVLWRKAYINEKDKETPLKHA